LALVKPSVAALLLVAVTTSAARSATIMIDDFVTQQSSLATAAAPANSSTASAPEAIGGERDMQVALISGKTALSLNVNPFGGELLIHDSGAQVRGYSLTVWDGMDMDPIALDPAGLGGLDLTDGGRNDKIRLSQVTADLTGSMLLTVYDSSDASGNTWSQAVVALPGGIFASADIDVPFTNFTNVGAGGAASFANVGAISMRIENTTTGSLDVEMASIFAVPEPAACLLATFGLLGLLIPLRRRSL
jgi:hypothetical protein